MPQSANFDPYHEWLAIPKDNRPPTHFELLGIATTEKNGKVIEMAAVRQSAFIRTLQAGPHGEMASRLLTEIAEARAVLSDPLRRRAYEIELARKQKPKVESAIEVVPPVVRVAAPKSKASIPIVEEADEVVEVVAPRRPKRRPVESARNSSDADLIKLLIGIGGVVVVVVAAILILRNVRKQPDMAQDIPAQSISSLPMQKDPAAPPPKEDKDPSKEVKDPKKDSLPAPKDSPKQESTSNPPANSSKESPKPENKTERPGDPPKETPKAEAKPLKKYASEWKYQGSEPHRNRRTGFVLSPNGLFLTTNSFVRENPDKFFVAVGANAYRAKVVKQSEELDLALLQLEGASDLPSLTLATDAPLKTGAELKSFGFKNAGAKCSAKLHATAKVIDDKGKLEVASSAKASSIGGPIVNAKGLVVGALALLGQSTGECTSAIIPVSEIIKWTSETEVQTSLKTAISPTEEPPDVTKCVGLAVGISNRGYKKFSDSIQPLPGGHGVQILGLEVQNDEHNVLLIDEAIERLSVVRAGDLERATMYFLPKCRPNYRKNEVLDCIKEHLKLGENQGRALLAYARFEDDAYDIILKKYKSIHEYQEALAITGDPRFVDGFVSRIRSKNSRDFGAMFFLYQAEISEDVALELYAKISGTESKREVIGLLGRVGSEKSIEVLRKIAPEGRKRVFGSTGDHAENAIHQIEQRIHRSGSSKISESFSIDYDIGKPRKEKSDEEKDKKTKSQDADKDDP